MRRAFHPKKEAEAKKGREWRECEALPYQKCLECCVGNTYNQEEVVDHRLVKNCDVSTYSALKMFRIMGGRPADLP